LCFGDLLACEVVQHGERASGWVWRLGEDVDPVSDALVETQRDRDGTPVATRWVLGHELEVTSEVVAVATVPLGADVRRVRALCRASATDDAAGAGWLDWEARASRAQG
jgi:hypothetical protein